jgi:glutamate carboxypeptidase
MKPRQILDYFARRQFEIGRSIREIVEIESPSNNFNGSLEVSLWIEHFLRELPLDIKIERNIQDGAGSHLVIRAFQSSEKCFLLVGHTDTVHPIGTKRKNPTRNEYGKFYGCGIFDMKSNIVLMLEALRFFAETGETPARPVTIVLSCDEEVGSASGRPLIEREAAYADQCFVFEPSLDGKVKTGRKGTAMFTLRAHGIPAHAGLEPEKGAGAVLEIARQIDLIDKLNDPENGTTVNVCTIKGGTATNVIPENAECSIDVRFSTADEERRIVTALEGLRAVDDRVRLEISGGVNRPPMERTEAVIKMYERARELAASFDYELGEAQVGGASDGNFVAAMGVPVLDGLGVTGAGAHTLEEHIVESDIAKRATLITLLLASE